MTPLVSILIPAYNAAAWLQAALNSALAQSHRALEIVVVDDGSTDATGEIIAEYARNHCCRLRALSQTNQGQSAAANRALAEAKGDYVKFFDADDLLSPEAIAVQVAALRKAPSHRLAYGAWARFHSNPAEAHFESRPGWRDADAPVDWICETWANAQPMYQCGLWLIPRALLNKTGGWLEGLSLINDFEFFTRLVLASDGIVHTPDARLYYRSGVPGSLSGQKSRRAWESAHLSTRLACQHLLACEDSARTRRVAADICQNLVHSLYPEHPDLIADLRSEVRRLGGSSLRPDGGRTFRLLVRTFGWRCALRLRRARDRGKTAE